LVSFDPAINIRWDQRTFAPVTSVAVRFNGGCLAAGLEDGTVRLYPCHLTAATPRLTDNVEVLTVSPAKAAVRYVAFATDGSLVTLTDEGLSRWDLETRQPRGPLENKPVDIRAAMLLPDGRRLLLSCESRVMRHVDAWDVRVWDAVTGKERFLSREARPGETPPTLAVAQNPI